MSAPRRRAALRRATGHAATLAVSDVHSALHQMAPFDAAADWDNVGLLAGDMRWPTTRALLAIDLTDAVADEALRDGADLLIVYHPPIFKGIRAVTAQADGPTTRLAELLAARVSIVALHTAWDVAVGGTNDVLLDALEVVARFPLQPQTRSAALSKLVVFVPEQEADALRSALAAAGAGSIGAYRECSFASPGRGSFRGDSGTSPTIGAAGRLEFVSEIRLEMVVPRSQIAPVVRALYAAHSYEEPAFDLYPLDALAQRGQSGMGRVGRLPRATRGVEILRQLDGTVDLSAAQIVGDLRRKFTHVTAAAGAFGAQAFTNPDWLVLTGELKHHDALALQKRSVCAVCLGHYASERPLLAALRARLSRALPLDVRIARADCAPLTPIAALVGERSRGRSATMPTKSARA